MQVKRIYHFIILLIIYVLSFAFFRMILYDYYLERLHYLHLCKFCI